MKVFAKILGALIILYSCTTNNPPVNRLSTNFNQGWQFQLAKAPADHPENSEEAWKDVDIPHDWSIEQGFADTARTGGRGGYFSGGIGWYKKTFQVPADYKDKNAVIEFDGVYKDADIWMNDAYVGHHQHGYLSFSFDVSQYLKTDSSNTILVKVDNSD